MHATYCDLQFFSNSAVDCIFNFASLILCTSVAVTPFDTETEPIKERCCSAFIVLVVTDGFDVCCGCGTTGRPGLILCVELVVR